MYLLCGAALVVLFAVQVDAREPEPPDPIRPQMLEADEAMDVGTRRRRGARRLVCT